MEHNPGGGLILLEQQKGANCALNEFAQAVCSWSVRIQRFTLEPNVARQGDHTPAADVNTKQPFAEWLSSELNRFPVLQPLTWNGVRLSRQREDSSHDRGVRVAITPDTDGLAQSGRKRVQMVGCHVTVKIE